MKRIVVIGPESTGKSTLSEQLARHYNTTWCPEYAREYLLMHGKHYSAADVEKMAMGQMKLEAAREKEARNGVYVIDTNLYVMKVWFEVVFDNCPAWILKEIARKKNDYHLYLLCQTDLPWVQDELREYPDLDTRNRLYKMYYDLVISSGTPWVEIKGTEEERKSGATRAIDELITTR